MYNKLKYLSPSSIETWRQNQEKFYLRYLSPNPPPRDPQTRPMALGACFDGLVKTALQMDLGLSCVDYASQVDPKWRTAETIDNANLVFDTYRKSGRYDKLVSIASDEKVDFCDDGKHRTVNGVPLFGKPDLVIGSAELILDWKVNGFYSHASPHVGYTYLDGDIHRKAQLMVVGNVVVNVAQPIDQCLKIWGIQLCIYKWLCSDDSCPGTDPGPGPILGIDQLVCDSRATHARIRVAQYRGYIDVNFEAHLKIQVSEIWNIVNSDHIFHRLSLRESQARCKVLDGQANSLRELEGII